MKTTREGTIIEGTLLLGSSFARLTVTVNHRDETEIKRFCNRYKLLAVLWRPVTIYFNEEGEAV
jgi:hypothetical protein